MEENVKVVEANDARVDDVKKNAVKGENTSDMEIVVDRMKETFGIKASTESTIEAGQKERDRTKQLVPFLCLIMGASASSPHYNSLPFLTVGAECGYAKDFRSNCIQSSLIVMSCPTLTAFPNHTVD